MRLGRCVPAAAGELSAECGVQPPAGEARPATSAGGGVGLVPVPGASVAKYPRSTRFVPGAPFGPRNVSVRIGAGSAQSQYGSITPAT